MKIVIALSFLAICLIAVSGNATEIPGGYVSGNWYSSGNPYNINGEITIQSGTTLNIHEGVEVIFQGHYKLIVNGWLEAVGTEQDSILFTAMDTLEGWHGIRFINTPHNSHLLFCIMQYGRATGSGMDLNGGGIYSYFSNPSINHCRISQNSAENMGGGIFCWASNGTIEHCVVSRNMTNDWNGRGGGICCSCSDLNISNCTVVGNTAGGSLDFGGGIYCGDSSPTIVNTVVEGNNGNGGIYLDGCCIDFLIAYNDLFNNEGGNFTGYPFQGLGEIVTVNLNGDSCDIFYNIFANPLFMDPVVGNFYLQTGSACIDAGDPSYPFDPDSTIADIGAFFYDQSVWIKKKPSKEIPTEFVLYGAFPNPFNPATTISFDLPVASYVKLVVFDLNGRNVGARHASPLLNTDLQPGHHTITFDGTNLDSGVYIYHLQAGEFTATGKMVLMK